MSASNGFINFRIYGRYRTDLQRSMIKKINNPAVLKDINQHILDEATHYVPARSGALRRSGYATSQTIGWRTPYAHYQYQGEVWGPNLPGWIGNKGVFRSPRHKYPTGEMLGATPGMTWLPARFVWDAQNGIYRRATASTPPVPVRFGYSTPGTRYQWFRIMWAERKRSIQAWTTSRLRKALKGGK